MKKMLKACILGMLFMLCLTAVAAAGAEDGVIRLPAGTLVIEEQAFFGTENIKSVIVPETVQRIEKQAFAESGVEYVSLPASLDYIADDAFDGVSDSFCVDAPEGSYAMQWVEENRVSVAPALYFMEQGMQAMGYAGDMVGLHVIASGENLQYQWYYEAPGAQTAEKLDNAEATYELEITENMDGARFYCEVTDSFGRTITSDICTVHLARNTADGLIYAVDEEIVYILGYEGKAAELYVPAAIEGYPVKVIRSSAFVSSESLQRIEIAEGVEIIGSGAFADSHLLEEVVLPSTLKELKNGAFINCYALREIDIPAGITMIYNDTFSDCTSLESVQLPDGLKTIDTFAFLGCDSLKAISIPETVTTIGASAFSGCSSLAEVKLPSGLKKIENSLFRGCAALEEIDLPDGVESIGSSAFSGCTSLFLMDLPDDVKTIGDRAFCDCTALRYVDLPASLTFIHDGAFKGCSEELALRTQSETYALEWRCMVDQNFRDYYFQLDMPSVVADKAGCTVTIEAHAEGLVSEYVWYLLNMHGDSTMHKQPFTGNTATIELMEEAKEQWLLLDATDVFGDTRSVSTQLLVVDEGLLYTVKQVGEALRENAVITGWAGDQEEIRIPETVFWYDIAYPVTAVADGAFSGCHAKRVYIPSGVESIGEGAFADCLDTVFHVEKDSAAYQWCVENNKSVYELKITLQPKNAAADEGEEVTLSVAAQGDGLTYAWYGKAAEDAEYTQLTCTENEYTFTLTEDMHGTSLYCEVADQYGNIILSDAVTLTVYEPVPEGLEYTIKDDQVTVTAYSGSLSKLVVPATIQGYPVKKVQDFAFETNNKLEEIVFSEGIETLGSVIYQCRALKRITIPASVTSIGAGPIGQCHALEEVIIHPDNAAYKFENGALLTKDGTRLVAVLTSTSGCYTVPDGVEVIGEYCFEACVGMTKLVIPEGVARMEGYAFDYCEGLECISFPESMTQIDDQDLSTTGLQRAIAREGSYAYNWCMENNLQVSSLLVIGIVDNFAVRAGDMLIVTVNVAGDAESYAWYMKKPGEEEFTLQDAQGAAYQSTMTAEMEGALIYCLVTSGNGETEVSDTLTIPLVPEGLQYQAANGEVTITSYTGSASMLKIPDYIEGMPVTGIGMQAFQESTTLQEIILPEGLTHVGNRAFWGCTDLRSITLPGAIGRVEEYTFCECASLETVVLQDGITSIGEFAFFNCNRLKNLTLPATLTVLEDRVFGDCGSLETVQLPDGMKSLGEYVFAASGVKRLILPESIDNMKELSLYGAWAEGMKAVAWEGSYAYNHCTTYNVPLYQLQITQQLPETVQCIAGQEICLTVEAEGDGLAYQWYLQMPGAAVPSRLNSDENCVSVMIDENMNGAQLYCCLTDMYGWTVDSARTEVALMKGEDLFIREERNGEIWITGYLGQATVLEVPGTLDGLTVVGIDVGAFKDQVLMTALTLPDTLVAIGDEAFKGCEVLKTINPYTDAHWNVFFSRLPAALTEMGEGAFAECKSLGWMEFPASLETIPSEAFLNCYSMSGAKFNQQKLTVADDAFTAVPLFQMMAHFGSEAAAWCQSRSGNNTDVYFISDPDEFTFELGASYHVITGYIGDSETVVTPAYYNGKRVGKMNPASIANNDTIKALVINSSLHTLMNGAIENCSNLEYVYIGRGVTYFTNDSAPNCPKLSRFDVDEKNSWMELRDGNVLYNKNGLEISCYPQGKTGDSYTVADGVTSVIPGAFAGAYNLKKVTLPQTLTNVNNNAFAGSGVEEVIILGSGVRLYETSFKDCIHLKKVECEEILPSGNYVFAGCTALEEMTMNMTNMVIYQHTFEGCTGMKKAVIPAGISVLDKYSFKDCTALEEVIFLSDMNYIDPTAFEGCPEDMVMVVNRGSTAHEWAVGAGYEVRFASGEYYYTLDEEENAVIVGYTGAEEKCEVPASLDGFPVKEIGSAAFRGCTQLKEITLPDTLANIAEDAFADCPEDMRFCLSQAGTYAYLWCVEHGRNIVLPTPPAMQVQLSAEYEQEIFPGDTVSFDILVINQGGKPLEDVEVVCSLAGLSWTVDSLRVGQECKQTVVYTITDADMENFVLECTAAANGVYQDPEDGEVYSVTDTQTQTIPLFVSNPSMQLEVTGLPENYLLGEWESYNILVTNTGNEALQNIRVVSSLWNQEWTIDALNVGEEYSLRGEGMFIEPAAVGEALLCRVTADAEYLHSVTGEKGKIQAESEGYLRYGVSEPAINVQASLNKEQVSLNEDTIEVTAEYSNTGNVALTNVRVTYLPITNEAVNIASLFSGESSFGTRTYTVTNEDRSKGAILFTVRMEAEFLDPATGEVTELLAEEELYCTVEGLRPDVDISITADKDSVCAAGDVINLCMVVKNYGNVPLYQIEVISKKADYESIVETLTVNGSQTLYAQYKVTEQDLLDGEIVFDTTAWTLFDDYISGKEYTVMFENSVTCTVEDAAPRLEVHVMADNVVNVMVGDTIRFTVDVTNEGNVPLTNIEAECGLTGDCWMIASLMAGEKQTFYGEYVVKESDLLNGNVFCFVEAEALYTFADGSAEAVYDEDDEMCTTVSVAPSIQVQLLAEPDGIGTVGTPVSFTVEVINTGNVTLFDVAVSSSELDKDWLLSELLPGDTVRLDACYIMTREDVDSGEIRCSVQAESLFQNPEDGETERITDEDQLICPMQTADPAIDVTLDADQTADCKAGDTIEFTVSLCNIGNVPLQEVNVSGLLLGYEGVIEELAVGETHTLTLEYTVTEEDFLIGEISCTVTASALADTTIGAEPGTIWEEDTLVIGMEEALPGMQVNIRTDPLESAAAGDTVVFYIEVINTGNVTLQNIRVISEILGEEWMIDSLLPDEIHTLQTEYRMTEADVQEGVICCSASAETSLELPAAGETKMIQAEKEVFCAMRNAEPKISVTVLANMHENCKTGDMITFTIEVVNNGDTALYDIDVTNTLTQRQWKIDSLPAGEQRMTTIYHVVEEEDIIRGSVRCAVQAKAEVLMLGDGKAYEVLSEDEDVCSMEEMNASLGVENIVDMPKVYNQKEVLTYEIVVSNTGNLTLRNIRVVSSLTGNEWVIEEMCPYSQEVFMDVYQMSSDTPLDENSCVCNTVTAEAVLEWEEVVTAQTTAMTLYVDVANSPR